MHVLQIYECQKEQCKGNKEEANRENSAQGITASLKETMKNRRQEDIEEGRDKFFEDKEKYTPQKTKEKKVVCTSN